MEPFKPISGGVEIGLGSLFDGQEHQSSSPTGFFSANLGPQWEFRRGIEFNSHLFLQQASLIDPIQAKPSAAHIHGVWSGGLRLDFKFTEIPGAKLVNKDWKYGATIGLEFGPNLHPTDQVNVSYIAGYAGFCSSMGAVCVAGKEFVYGFSRDTDFAKGRRDEPNFVLFGFGVFLQLDLGKL